MIYVRENFILFIPHKINSIGINNPNTAHQQNYILLTMNVTIQYQRRTNEINKYQR